MLAALSTFKEIRQVSGINQGLPNSEVHGLKKQKCSDCFARGKQTNEKNKNKIKKKKRRKMSNKRSKGRPRCAKCRKKRSSNRRMQYLVGSRGDDVGAGEGGEEARLKGWAGQPGRHLLPTPLHNATVHACHCRPASHAKAVRPLISLSHSP